MASPVSAAGAYASIANLIGSATTGGGAAAAQKAGGGFGEMLEKSLAGMAEQGRATDAQAMQAVTGGKSDVVDVVTAVAESELALDTLVSVRDKVIAAYEEIMRMPI
ncbi:flagellar hook-basal body complex protein FliE [Hansschlegelia quercus]|uniref:Flagellar hook-basal body complex protein FliE n=1 Tax=Hansschlegelia quercus TaxID=2528245 RepID=A0A4V2JEF8_9HYPH|nr:flagellar hook-basal body complex protein FliE [Hansschlegelia quercus]TBN55056.1 flagellar hook-basal body complex protein FliE [Hansschlegelia quercus]